MAAAAMSGLALSASNPGAGSNPGASAPLMPYGLVLMPSNTGALDPLIAEPGKAPFFPSRATTDGRTLTPAMFDEPEFCAGCHLDIYNQWKNSMMAHGWDDPVYRALLNLASKDTGGKVDNFCVGCHSPVGLVTGEVKSTATGFTDQGMSKVSLAGVHCDVCHSISGAVGTGNGSFVLAPRMVGDRLKLGPRKDAISPGHHTAFSELHTRSEFCATCHNVTHPFNRMPIERTYDEWRDSPYNALGVQCQDCHMMPHPGVIRNPGKASPLGKDRDSVYTHGFVGGNVAVLRHLGADEQARLTREMLRSAATIALVDLPRSIPTGGLARIAVRVTNSGAGHKLPTGFPEGREVWIDLAVYDARGRQVYRLGAVKDGATEPGTKSFRVELGDPKGNSVHVKAWEADRILFDTRIPPKGYAEEEYAFNVPRDAKGPLTVRARLNYWPFSPAFLKELMADKAIQTERVEMAVTEGTIDVISRGGEAVRTGRTAKGPAGRQADLDHRPGR
jgi:cytochrome c554/c'-like protein